MSLTGDALRKASSTVSAALAEALSVAGAEGQGPAMATNINTLLEVEQSGQGATGAVNACLTLAGQADQASLNPPPADGN